MKSVTTVMAALGLALVTSQAAGGEDKLFPSPYGADDQIGAANNLSPKTVLAARDLISQGRTYALGIEVNRDTPAYPPRFVSVTVMAPSQAGGRTFGENEATYNDDIFTGWLGVGTQIDGLGHLGRQHTYYNNRKAEDIVRPTGLTELGIEHVPPIATRGVLLDIAGHRGVEMMKGGEVITVEDLEGAMEAQGVSVGKGDVVLLHTGWLNLLGEDNQRFASEEPGLGVAAARFLAERGVVAVGADTWGLEAVPHADPKTVFPVHVELLARHGVYILENINTHELRRDQAWEFMFVLGPARLTGAVQMIINPVAIR